MDSRASWQDPGPIALRRLLKGPKPGLPAQTRMAPRPRPGWPPEGDISPRQGSVLILLYPHRGWLHLVLTRRTETVENHKGQIALPGGRREGDESEVQTALREAQEELGVASDAIQPLGTLTPLYIPPSDFCITPVVGWARVRPHWRPDSSEVAQVLEVSLRYLADPVNVREEQQQRGSLVLQVPYFLVQGHKVWGATAMVLSEFLVLVQGRAE